MTKLLGRLAPVVLVGQVVDGECPFGADAAYARVVVGSKVQRGPGGQMDAAVLEYTAFAFVAQTQAGAQAGHIGPAVLGEGTQCDSCLLYTSDAADE